MMSHALITGAVAPACLPPTARRPANLPTPTAAGPYRLPRGVYDRLEAAVGDRRNASAVMLLATFLGRFHTAPGRLGRPFAVDRVALADHPELKLSEARIRGALEALEAVGFLERVEVKGSAYQATEHGLRRKPVQWRLGVEYLAGFTAANARAKAARGAPAPTRRPTARPEPQRLSAANVVASKAIPQPPVARIQSSAVASFYSGEQNRAEPTSPLEAAIERLRRGVGL